MFFYDWPKIYDTSQGNVVEIVRIFRMIVEKQIELKTKLLKKQITNRGQQ